MRKVITRLALGEACDLGNAGNGVIVVEQLEEDSLYRVFVVGGLLPEGEDEKRFANAYLAIRFASQVFDQLFEDSEFYS